MRQQFVARKYQPPVISHLLEHKRCGVFLNMGMGKTVSTLTALDGLFLTGAETKPAIIFAPYRVANETWPQEAAKWQHLSGIEVQPIIGDIATRRRALRNKNAAVFTINYENVPWLMEHLGDAWPFGVAVADECTKLKGFRLRQGTTRARALAKVAHKKCTRWFNLTGTPSPNGLKDLWGQMWFIDAGLRLGRTFDAFQQRWFYKTFDGYNIEPLPFAQEQIQERIKDVCISLNPKDYFDIKDPIVTPVYVDLPTTARAHYHEMERHMFAEVQGCGVEAFNAAGCTLKCLQLANGAAYVDPNGKQWKDVHDAKIAALESVIEEAAGMPVLVAYHFRSDLQRLRAAFPKGRELDKDPQTRADWNAGKIPVLFAHPASAGHGIDLQHGGNIIVFFGHWWDLEQYQQIVERIGPVRQMQSGYDRPVYIYNIIARDTVDEMVIARRETKRSVQDLLMEAVNKRGGV
jgi:SNF2 family DNA or RNA helicase